MNRRGMTLVELMIAMVVFGIVMGSAMAAFRSQSQGFVKGTDRMNVIQNVRYVANMLEMELRAVGSGVPDIQPYLVYADDDVIAFNANYTSNVLSDVFAVYIDPDAPNGSVSALTLGTRITIPNSSFLYPDTTYLSGPSNSPAETIVFFLTPDSSTSRTDDYALFRQVNQDAPELVARNLLQSGTTPFFQYYRQVTAVGGLTSIQPVPNASLPLRHSVKIHLAPGDTAGLAAIDSLRGVRVTLLSTNGKIGTEERTREISRLVRLPNAGIASRKTCGDEPLPVTGLVASPTVLGTGQPAVNLTWPQALDEGSGEQDVVRYVIWRRLASNPSWGDPYLSIPSGNPTYAYQDAAVTSGDNLMYAVAAQDCTPQLSTMNIAGPVAVP